MSSFSSHLRRNLLTGLLVIGPLGVSVWVLYHLFHWIDHLLWERVRLSFLHEGGIPGVGFVLVLLLVYLTGLATTSYVGGRIVRAWEQLLLRIPLFNKIYLAAKQVGEAFLSPQRASVFSGVGLVAWPRPGCWALVFRVNSASGALAGHALVREGALPGVGGGDLLAVFMPTVPNPTTGNLLFVPRAEFVPLNLSVEDALKMVISGGMVAPPGPPPAGVVALPGGPVAEARGA